MSGTLRIDLASLRKSGGTKTISPFTGCRTHTTYPTLLLHTGGKAEYEQALTGAGFTALKEGVWWPDEVGGYRWNCYQSPDVVVSLAAPVGFHELKCRAKITVNEIGKTYPTVVNTEDVVIVEIYDSAVVPPPQPDGKTRVSMTLEPAGARSAGARWAVAYDGSTKAWQDSGAVVVLPFDKAANTQHGAKVVFRTVSGYTAPAAAAIPPGVDVAGGTAEYAAGGSLPPPDPGDTKPLRITVTLSPLKARSAARWYCVVDGVRGALRGSGESFDLPFPASQGAGHRGYVGFTDVAGFETPARIDLDLTYGPQNHQGYYAAVIPPVEPPTPPNEVWIEQKRIEERTAFALQSGKVTTLVTKTTDPLGVVEIRTEEMPGMHLSELFEFPQRFLAIEKKGVHRAQIVADMAALPLVGMREVRTATANIESWEALEAVASELLDAGARFAERVEVRSLCTAALPGDYRGEAAPDGWDEATNGPYVTRDRSVVTRVEYDLTNLSTTLVFAEPPGVGAVEALAADTDDDATAIMRALRTQGQKVNNALLAEVLRRVDYDFYEVRLEGTANTVIARGNLAVWGDILPGTLVMVAISSEVL